MREAGAVAALVGLAIRVGRCKVATNAGATLIDCAADFLADFPLERDAPGVVLVSSLEDAAEGRQVFGQLRRDAARCGVVAFRPIERRPKEGATRPASKARIQRHRLHAPQPTEKNRLVHPAFSDGSPSGESAWGIDQLEGDSILPAGGNQEGIWTGEPRGRTARVILKINVQFITRLTVNQPHPTLPRLGGERAAIADRVGVENCSINRTSLLRDALFHL